MDNLLAKMVVSPPTTYPPKVVLKGKRLIFNFDNREELKENTTYSINFGDGIKDLTEGNAAKNLRFVMSTGDEIDSAKVSGRVNKAFEKEPAKECLIMLYQSDNDSVVIKRKPDYFAKTTETGSYDIENIRPGAYKMFALKDENLNYLYDLDVELIGFLDSMLVIGKNEIKLLSPIDISREMKPPRLMEKKSDRVGLVFCGFSGNPNLVSMKIVPENENIIPEIDKDTLKLWYNKEIAYDWQVQFDNGSRKDTVFVKPATAKVDKQRSSLIPLNKRIFFNRRLQPSKPIDFDFTNPIVKIDTSKMFLRLDSVKISPSALVKKDKPRQLLLDSDWKEGGIYTMVFQKGSITDIFGNTNDSLQVQWKVLSEKELGNISIHLNNLKPEQQYVVQLLNANGEVIEKFIVDKQDKWETQILNQYPGQYEVLIIDDINRNKQWDPVNLGEHKQAEPIFRKKPEPLRANWELDVNISL